MKLSVIIPAYNCEKYIASCLDSLINQDCARENYEIIITDDGSTDKTGKICDDYAKKFAFIHVTHTKNFGPSHARNVALENSTGEYILFCDADDFVSPQLISVVSRAIKIFGRPDFISCRFFTSDDFSGFPKYDVEGMKKSDGEFSDGEEFCCKVLGEQSVQGYLWNKAIRREIIGGVRFDESVSRCEDDLFLVSILTQREKIRACCVKYFLYCYCNHENVGLTRDIKNACNHDGVPKFIISREKILSIKGLPKRAARINKIVIYNAAFRSLYHRKENFNAAVRKTLRNYVRRYARDYFFFSNEPLNTKIEMFVKSILVLLHGKKFW